MAKPHNDMAFLIVEYSIVKFLRFPERYPNLKVRKAPSAMAPIQALLPERNLGTVNP
jgi:hypothetical protein